MDLYSGLFPQFWFRLLKWGGGYVIEKGVAYLINWILHSRREIMIQKQHALLLPNSQKSEKNNILQYCNQAERALNRLENYINQHRYEHEKIQKFLVKLYKEELEPLAERMDKVEARLQHIYSWK